jgi:hypothetical protein
MEAEMMSKTKSARIVDGTMTGGAIPTSTKSTGLSQRQTLEATMLNLANALGIETITKRTSARDAEFYRPDGFVSFQSATNTILEMSARIAALDS